jgi:hypothetical protein
MSNNLLSESSVVSVLLLAGICFFGTAWKPSKSGKVQESFEKSQTLAKAGLYFSELPQTFLDIPKEMPMV